MNKEEFIEKIKELKINTPDGEFFLEYNLSVYNIIDENENLKQVLKDIKEYIKSREYKYDDEDHSGIDYFCDGNIVLQIIDKVLGGSDENK